MLSKLIDKFKEIELLQGIFDTLYMVIVSATIAYIIGILLGLILVISDKDGIKPSKLINTILGLFINLGRSIPFIVLMVFLIPLTELIVGKSWGATAAIVPLTIGAIPFVARLAETHFKEVDKGLIESAKCLGASNYRIAKTVYLSETLPSLVRTYAVTIITLIGYSAMAGAIGAGGLGDIAIKWGYRRYDELAMIISIVVIILIVQLMQITFDVIAKKVDKAR